MSLQICQHIKAVLNASTPVKSACNGRFYHIVAPLERQIQYPYIEYASDGFDEEDTKAFDTQDAVSCTITIVSKNSEQLGDIAHKVRKAFEAHRTASYTTFVVVDQSLRVGPEDKNIATDAYFLDMHYTFITEPIIN